MVTFVIGGMTGVLMAVPPADFVLHNSLFLVAHFHNVIIGGCAVRCDRGLHLLVSESVRFQAATKGLGRKPSFWFWLIGFYVAFMPLYALGLMGMTRACSTTTFLRGVRGWWLRRDRRGGRLLRGLSCRVAQLVVSDPPARELLRRYRAIPGTGVATLEWATRIAAAGLAILRCCPHVAGARCLLEHQAARSASRRQCATSLSYDADRDTDEQSDRLHLRILRHRLWDSP